MKSFNGAGQPLILTQEQKAMRLAHHLHGEQGQANRYSTACSRALNAVSDDLTAEGARPSLPAVLSALANGLAHYLAMIDDQDARDRVMADMTAQIPGEVSKRAAERAMGETQGEG
jgi:hypothetical protein